MNSSEYQSLLDSLPYGKRLPGAVYLLDSGDDFADLTPNLCVTVAELRKRLDIGPDFNLLKSHTASPKISLHVYGGDRQQFNREHDPIRASSSTFGSRSL